MKNFYSAACPSQVHSADTWLGEEEGPALRPQESATNNLGGRPPDDLPPTSPASQPLKNLQSSRLDANCYECSVRWADWNPRSAALKYFSRYRDPQPEDLVMYLHALRYTVSNVNFKWRQTLKNSPLGQFLDIPNPPPRLGRTRLDWMKTAVCVSDLKFIQMSRVMSC